MNSEVQNAIKLLKGKGYKIEEPKNKFAQVKLSKYKGVLLENKKSLNLIVCWEKEGLNDFEYLARGNGQFWINGHLQPVELKFGLNNKWIRFDGKIHGRFLR